MRDRVERFVVLPFTAAGCVSQSSVDVVPTQPKKPKSSDHQSSPAAVVTRRQEREESSSRMKTKNSWGFMALPKPKISSGIHRLVRSFKSLSQLFVYKGEEEKEELEAEEMEMEIGFPTDVKHVTHIGWDGTATTNPVKGWENLAAQTEILSFPSISLRQFELAMAAQTHDDGPPVCTLTASKFT